NNHGQDSGRASSLVRGAGCREINLRIPRRKKNVLDISFYRPGRFAVRRLTIRKRMRSKLREIKQQLRPRMHDPVRQTGAWLRSVVQGYFNYYAVPGNIGSLSLFRDRLLGIRWRTLCRRSQQRLPWTRLLKLGDRWLPRPIVLLPYPAVRFAATHPR
ncbi:MAG: hypothetical protein WB762_31865, partial [Candidatus Sulfotelmatobacter sp.]